MGYSPWGRKELDTTEHPHAHVGGRQLHVPLFHHLGLPRSFLIIKFTVKYVFYYKFSLSGLFWYSKSQRMWISKHYLKTM